MGKLQLNDSAFVYQSETSVALGFGFRCGFSVCCIWKLCRNGCGENTAWTSSRRIERGVSRNDERRHVKQIDNPAFLPEPNYIQKIEEPMVKAFVICPNENIGDMMALITRSVARWTKRKRSTRAGSC